MTLPIPFDNPTTYKGHSGVDFPGHAGEPIPASGPGVVSWLGRNTRGGYYIWIKYDDIGPKVGYHHMNSHDGCPAVGRRVDTGDRLGYVGWSGHVVPAGRAGAHLHSEVEGHATTAGYWKFFDPTRVVGTHSAGNTSPIEKEEEMTASFINVQGKAGSHEAGTFAIMRSNAGQLFAKRMTRGTLLPGAPTIENGQLAAWQGSMKFYEL